MDPRMHKQVHMSFLPSLHWSACTVQSRPVACSTQGLKFADTAAHRRVLGHWSRFAKRRDTSSCRWLVTAGHQTSTACSTRALAATDGSMMQGRPFCDHGLGAPVIAVSSPFPRLQHGPRSNRRRERACAGATARQSKKTKDENVSISGVLFEPIIELSLSLSTVLQCKGDACLELAGGSACTHCASMSQSLNGSRQGLERPRVEPECATPS
jgi:hypothetical protein